MTQEVCTMCEHREKRTSEPPCNRCKINPAIISEYTPRKVTICNPNCEFLVPGTAMGDGNDVYFPYCMSESIVVGETMPDGTESFSRRNMVRLKFKEADPFDPGRRREIYPHSKCKKVA